MMENPDVVIIGSGFGGAVTACRLAEKGMKVLILERGRRWAPADYPRSPEDDWVFDHGAPEKRNGWIDWRSFKDMGVIQGAGVGGGSLIYANVIIDPTPERFERGWPAGINLESLRPYYERVEKMLGVNPIPKGQYTQRYKLMKEGAEALGYGDRFSAVPQAITFDPDWNYDLEDCFSEKHSKTWINPQQRSQGTCIHCGDCVIGCRVKAKNTLDLNYLAVAEAHGAEILPLHMVHNIEPMKGGYRVHFDKLNGGQKTPGHVDAPKVILAAGSLGSTELLLRCRDLAKTLPNISAKLGHKWSSNGDFMTPAFYKSRDVSPTQGPTISSSIDLRDGKVNDQRVFIEDGGFPDVLGNVIAEQLRGLKGLRYLRLNSKLGPMIKGLAKIVRKRSPLQNTMPWFAQGVDAGNGRLLLKKKGCLPWRREWKLDLDWKIRASRPLFNAIIKTHKRLSRATGGKPVVSPLYTFFEDLITPHPLGGCIMGANKHIGVVNDKGEVFGYPNLFVVDGAIIPRAIGTNPSKTIAALAERISDFIEKSSPED